MITYVNDNVLNFKAFRQYLALLLLFLKPQFLTKTRCYLPINRDFSLETLTK